MSHYLIELYTPKPAWLALNADSRRQFFAAIDAGMSALAELGIEAIAMGQTDFSKVYSTEQSFFAIWRFPDDNALNALISGIAASGWHDYFATINVAGVGMSLADHLMQLAVV